jgi:ferrous iron transport protein B
VKTGVQPRTYTVALAGNPNTGKTVVFNLLTGLHQQTGNYPGVTVEKKTGRMAMEGVTVDLIDTPGIYSLSAFSVNEEIASHVLMGQMEGVPVPDLIVDVVDASNLRRNLYLTTQLLELGRPMIVVLNMMDLAERRGFRIDAGELSRRLKVPVIPMVAAKRQGIDRLNACTREQLLEGRGTSPPFLFPPPFEQGIGRIAEGLSGGNGGDSSSSSRAEALRRLFDGRKGCACALGCCRAAPPVASVDAVRGELAASHDFRPDSSEAQFRYGFIKELTRGVLQVPAGRSVTWTDRIDAMLTHRVFGVLFFVLLMALVFQSIFSWAGPLMGFIDWVFGTLGGWTSGLLPEGTLRSLMVDGVIGGVGGCSSSSRRSASSSP